MTHHVEIRTAAGRVVSTVVEASNAALALAQVLHDHAAHFAARPFAHLSAVAGPAEAISKNKEGAKHG